MGVRWGGALVVWLRLCVGLLRAALPLWLWGLTAGVWCGHFGLWWYVVGLGWFSGGGGVSSWLVVGNREVSVDGGEKLTV